VSTFCSCGRMVMVLVLVSIVTGLSLLDCDVTAAGLKTRQQQLARQWQLGRLNAGVGVFKAGYASDQSDAGGSAPPAPAPPPQIYVISAPAPAPAMPPLSAKPSQQPASMPSSQPMSSGYPPSQQSAKPSSSSSSGKQPAMMMMPSYPMPSAASSDPHAAASMPQTPTAVQSSYSVSQAQAQQGQQWSIFPVALYSCIYVYLLIY